MPDITITPEDMEKVDKKIPSPSVRAEKIYEIIKEHNPEVTNWDILCFAIQSIGLFGAEHPWLEIPAKHLNRMLYIAHYTELFKK